MEQKETVNFKDATSLVNNIFIKAIESRASDIHIEPEESNLNIRLRIDGILYLVEKTEIDFKEALISRIKVLAQLDITEVRLPQDGHLEFRHLDRLHNMRVSTFPSMRGEAMVIRILNREDVIMKLEDIGLDQNQLLEVKRLMVNPFGMVMITGPTGSGKTSFLYSIINTLGTTGKNIMTIEDPIEVNMPGIRQAQVKDSIGLTFATAMRSVLRQDPNVVMLGEVRDAETAHLAFQAALSGAFVMTTFHTFDVPGLIIRLFEMGIPRSVLAHAIKGVISVRLVRKICPNCRNPRPFVTEGVETPLNIKGQDKECPMCHGIGYYGRIGVFEIVPFDEAIQFKILEGVSSSEIQAFFTQMKYKDLWQSAADKINQGITTEEEVKRVIGLEPK